MEAERQRIEAENLMEQFAENTGLAGKGSGQRYLWTDAFAVGNFLELHKRTNREKYLQLALNLVDQVHRILGRHRDINTVMLATTLLPDTFLGE